MLFSSLILAGVTLVSAGDETGLYGMEGHTTGGEKVAMSQYRGKVLLIVNTASRCGYTRQYGDLQKLHDMFNGQPFSVLAFPSNDFGRQEPGTNAEIAEFCKTNYGVTFPLFAKGAVKGENKQPVYRFLTSTAPEKGEVRWNFEKFLVDPEGRVIARFRSGVKPLSHKIIEAIENALKTAS